MWQQFLGAHAWDAIHKWLKHMGPLQAKLGRNPTLAEMGKKLKLSVSQIQNLLSAAKLSQGTSSLETPIDDEGNILIRDIISDKNRGDWI